MLNTQGAKPRLIAWTLAIGIATADRHIAAIRSQPPAPQPRQRGDEDRSPLTLEQQSILIAFYCQSSPLPGMQRWTLRIAADKINSEPLLLGRKVHPSTICRVLKRNHLRPHRSSYFLHIRDPLFFEKMHHVLAVYARNSKFRFCFDECPSIQAISRQGPDVKNDDGSTSREFVYTRHGTTDLLGFLQVSTGTVSAYCRPSHETETLIEVFTAHVLSQPADEQLHYICDNLFPHFNEEFCYAVADLSQVPRPSAGSLSTGEKRRQWLQQEDKKIVVHFLPFHGSWLNQIEVWFSLLKRYTLDDSWFDSVDALSAAILAFAETWNEYFAHPFNFQYDGKGLENVVLRRFTRILGQKPNDLVQMDTKFLADLSLLCLRLDDHHSQKISLDDWKSLVAAIESRKPELDAIIEAETGPRRIRRARKAFGRLCERIAA